MNINPGRHSVLVTIRRFAKLLLTLSAVVQGGCGLFGDNEPDAGPDARPGDFAVRLEGDAVCPGGLLLVQAVQVLPSEILTRIGDANARRARGGDDGGITEPVVRLEVEFGEEVPLDNEIGLEFGLDKFHYKVVPQHPNGSVGAWNSHEFRESFDQRYGVHREAWQSLGQIGGYFCHTPCGSTFAGVEPQGSRFQPNAYQSIRLFNDQRNEDDELVLDEELLFETIGQPDHFVDHSAWWARFARSMKMCEILDDLDYLRFEPECTPPNPEVQGEICGDACVQYMRIENPSACAVGDVRGLVSTNAMVSVVENFPRGAMDNVDTVMTLVRTNVVTNYTP